MEKKDLMQFCRYYKGESSDPFASSSNKLQSYIWQNERVWVVETSEQDRLGDHAATPNIDKWVDLCIANIPLGSQIPGDVPSTLKSAIFAVFLHNNELPIFKEFLVFFDKWIKKDL